MKRGRGSGMAEEGWMREAVRLLDKVTLLDEWIAVKEAEKRRMAERAVSLPSSRMDGMPVSGGRVSKRVEEGGIALAEGTREIDKVLARYRKERQSIKTVLQSLPPRQYGALYRHYFLGMTWEEAAEDMGSSVRNVYRLRRRGLRNVGRMVAAKQRQIERC